MQRNKNKNKSENTCRKKPLKILSMYQSIITIHIIIVISSFIQSESTVACTLAAALSASLSCLTCSLSSVLTNTITQTCHLAFSSCYNMKVTFSFIVVVSNVVAVLVYKSKIPLKKTFTQNLCLNWNTYLHSLLFRHTYRYGTSVEMYDGLGFLGKS